MKKILTYSLVILLLNLSVGAWILSVPVANFVKNRAQSEMKQASNQLEFQLGPGEFERIGTDELLIGGKLYDVVSEHRQGDSIRFVVYQDDLETFFLHFLMVDSEVSNSSKEKSPPLKTIVQDMLRLKFYLTLGYQFNQTVFFPGALPKNTPLILRLTSTFMQVLLPPPQVR